MNCTEFKGSLMAHFRRLLPPERADALRSHHAECPACQELVKQHQELSCRDFVEFVGDYLEDALEPGQLRGFERHLEICEDCVRFLESYRETVRLGRAAFAPSEEPVPGDVPEDLIQAILDARSAG